MRVSGLSNDNSTSVPLIQNKDHSCNMYAENIRCFGVGWRGGEDSYKRMDSKQAKNRSSLEHKDLLPSRAIQCWSSSSFSVLTRHRIMGKNCERRGWYVTESMPTAKEEDTASGKAIAKARPRQKPTVTLTSIFSCSWLEMDRHWNTTITRSKVLQSVKSCHSIVTTWSISPSRKRRSDPLRWHHRRVQEAEVRRRFAMVTWRLDIKFGKGRRSKEKTSILLRESKLFQSIPVTWSNFRTSKR